MTLGGRQERLEHHPVGFLSIMGVWGDWMTVMQYIGGGSVFK